MNNKKNIDENNLDELLNRLFLEKHADQVDEHSARFVFKQEYDVKIDIGKEKELIERLQGKTKGPGGYFKFLIILLIALIGGTLVYTKYKGSDTTPVVENAVEKEEGKEAGNNLAIPEQPPVAAEPVSKVKVDDSAATAKPIQEEKVIKRNPILTAPDISVYFPQSGVGSKSAATFFKPTEQDFIFYNQAKQMLVEKLFKENKETYASVPEKKLSYRGNAIALNAFVMRNQPVTNLEYKAFLADLVKKGKTEEFKKATVRNETWIKYNDNILATTYFFDEKYNDFPVVNISAEAAALFCNWLENELNRLSLHTDPKAKPLKVRLPFDAELIQAATAGQMQLPGCNGYATIYESKEGIITNEDQKRLQQIRKNRNEDRPEIDDLFSINRYGLDENQTLQLFEKGFTYIYKPVTDSVSFNLADVFSKVAHVAEIAQEQGTGNVLVVGSCWKNKQEYLTMLKKFNEAAASPFVGFRFVMTPEQ